MPTGRKRNKLRIRRGVALPVAALVMVAAAVAATAYVVVDPSYFPLLKAVPVSTVAVTSSSAVSSQPSLPSSSSSQVSSSMLSSSSSSSSSSSVPSSSTPPVGSYADFQKAVFIGDSLTSGIEEYSVTKTAGVFANNGMSTSAALTKKITVAGKSVSLAEAVKAAKPQRVYLLLGSNDISWMKADTFIENYGKLIDTLKAGTPDATYYIQSIFPVTAQYEKSSGVTNAQINDFNARLSQLCTKKGVKYLDAGSVLRGSDGKMIPAAAADGYNIKKAYYTAWLDYLTAHQ